MFYSIRNPKLSDINPFALVHRLTLIDLANKY